MDARRTYEMKKLTILAIAVLPLFVSPLIGYTQTGTWVAEYSSQRHDKTHNSVGYTLSIPTLKGQPLPAIRGVVVSTPGAGGSTAFQVNDRWAKWLYENGFAYFGVGTSYMSATGILNALDAYKTNTLSGVVYPELAHIPVLSFGPSAGGSSASYFAWQAPLRTIAFVVEHTRFYLENPSAATKDVPGYFRWGEWDNTRFDEGYWSIEDAAIFPMIQAGAQWMGLIEARQVHATQMYAIEEAMGFFSLMLPLRYDYQAGVAGKDPKLGAVTLTSLVRTNGWLGEHNLGAIQTATGRMPNLMRDWESRDPHYAPVASFERTDKTNHSWMANAALGAFWATKFSHGHQDLRVTFLDHLDDDLGTDMLTKLNSVAPNYYVAGQSIRVAVDPSAFPGVQRVDFYANDLLKGSVSAPPYEFSYTFNDGQEGMFAIYPVAVAASGERCVGPRRMAQIYPRARGTNTAPTVSNIGHISGHVGQTLAIPVTVGDAETSPGSLSVSWKFINRTTSIAAGTYPISISGSGADRVLNVTLPPNPGRIWGIVQVSDGDMSVNAYVTIHVKGDGSAPPFFVGNEAIAFAGSIQTHGAWSRRISVRVSDYSVDPADLILTATSSSPANIPNDHIRVGGSGEFRYIQVKPSAGAATITLTLDNGITNASMTYYANPVSHANTSPILSAIPNQTAWYSNESDPIDVRVYDLHTPNQAILPGETTLVVAVTSGNQTIIPNANITVSEVGPRRRITYTPAYNQTGTATLTATVTDAHGVSATQTFNVVVTAPPPLEASGGALANATIQQAYATTLSASGGIQPYAWSVVVGALPDGINFLANGVLTGTPTETGVFHFTARVTDSDPGGPTTNTAAYTLTVHSQVSAPTDLVATANTNATITLTWTDTAIGETGYEIQRREQGMGSWSTIVTTAPNADIHLDDDALTAGTTYEYRLRAVGTIEGPYTPVISAQALTTPFIITPPQPVQVFPGASGTLTVSAGGGALAYAWYEGASGNTNQPVAGVTTSELVVTNIIAPRTFWVQVSNPAGFVHSPSATISPSIEAPQEAYEIDDFDASPTLTTATSHYPEHEGWRLGSGAQSEIRANGGVDNTPYMEIKRIWRNSNPVNAGLFFSATNLVQGETYYLRFDYKVGVVGSETVHASSALRYSIAENNGGTAYANRIDQLSGIEFNAYGATTFMSNLLRRAGPVVTNISDWATYTSEQGFTFSANSTRIYVGIQAIGFGIHASAIGANYSYLGIDNIRLVKAGDPPENLDTDGDGIPDWWEQLHFGGSTNANADALAANGVNTIRETFLVGLDPANPGQVFELGTDFQAGAFLWSPAISGRWYSIFWSTNLQHGFAPLATNIPGPQSAYTTDVHTLNPATYFRIEVKEQP